MRFFISRCSRRETYTGQIGTFARSFWEREGACGTDTPNHLSTRMLCHGWLCVWGAANSGRLSGRVRSGRAVGSGTERRAQSSGRRGTARAMATARSVGVEHCQSTRSMVMRAVTRHRAWPRMCTYVWPSSRNTLDRCFLQSKRDAPQTFVGPGASARSSFFTHSRLLSLGRRTTALQNQGEQLNVNQLLLSQMQTLLFSSNGSTDDPCPSK